ncbi:OmpA family protein [Parachryseolinea silvisoli]|uniref:OmpA family protein n=1 Tax=Parachryseolinea silvisoli TaxID=2873601 RepID=UPI0022659CE2|nr:OmpA family protein [Parachryseolinea silvisoli]MCD9016300.1 OmpA family protein [Parachryseolinea silvisoli]
MKRLLITTLLLTGFSLLSKAQVVQWASSVIEFSSELTPIQYSAKQALGKPNVLPAGGQSPNAWAPDKPKRKEFLKLGFANPISIRQIAIAESHNPSAIFRVLAYDLAGKEYVINTLNPMAIPLKGRMLNIFVEQTPYKVAAVKIEFDGAAVPDYFSIDAVAISDSNYPIIADIPQMQMLASGILIEALDKNVNSEYKELNPLLSPDGKTLYFSRSNHPENVGGVNDKEDIWYSELDTTGHWQLAKNMGPQFNNKGPNFVNTIRSITPDGKTAIMVLGNRYDNQGKMSAGVSITSNVGGVWSAPKALNIKNDYNFAEKANYFLADNRKTLLMSVQRSDSHGDRDLYITFMNADSTWSEPLNLGDVINTAAEESGPFLTSDDKTLYFSSKGFSGYGGNDIYVSRRLDDTWTNWSEPENLGPEINSPLEDLFFNIPSSSDFAYYSRGVTETNTDIFRVKLPIIKSPEPWVTVRGKVIDKTTGKPVGAKIIYEQLPSGKELGITQSNPQTGEYEIRLPAGQRYGIRTEAEGKISENQNLDLRGITADKVIDPRNIDLSPLIVTSPQPEAVIVLNNVFFDFDKATLKPESYPELNRLVTFLNNNAGMNVQIAGHTDSVGPEPYNLDLSKRRANSVVQYLYDKGVTKEKVKTVFFGETKPIDTNATREGRQKNRRVEFKIVNL